MPPDETGLAGPKPFGTVGGKVASVARHDHSDAPQAAGAGCSPWTEAALDFPTSPEDGAPGGAMAFVGMPVAQAG